jgi:hypothetical protein
MIAGQKLGTEIGKKVIEKLKENGFRKLAIWKNIKNLF